MAEERASWYTRSHRSEAHKLSEQLLQLIPNLPGFLIYSLVGILACTENVFPPIPADTAIALGAFLSNTGAVSAWAVFGVTWFANVASAAGVYLAARSLGRPFFSGKLGRRLIEPKAMTRIEGLYERHGTWGIFLSRFIPGARAVIPPFAGVAGLKAARALPPMVLASAIWYGTLTYVAANLIPRIDDVAVLIARMNWVGLALLGIASAAVLTAIFVMWWRKRSKRNRPETTP